MIQMIVTYSCPRCESRNLVRNGHDYKGAQKYHCKDCHQYGTLNAGYGYPSAVREQVKRGLLERLSLRGLARLLSISRRTLSRWLQGWISQTEPALHPLLPAESEDILELDELRSFVGSKQQERWLWLALCRRTRQVVAYWVGDRSETGAMQLWRRIPHDYVRCASFSDRRQPYAHVFDLQRHHMVGKDTGQRAHVERWFKTLRQRLARFTRRTLAFSNRDDLHDGLLHLFINDYNLSCIS
jgi:insertion element IS1 protein InsB